jgi:hypothetical protein
LRRLRGFASINAEAAQHKPDHPCRMGDGLSAATLAFEKADQKRMARSRHQHRASFLRLRGIEPGAHTRIDVGAETFIQGVIGMRCPLVSTNHDGGAPGLLKRECGEHQHGARHSFGRARQPGVREHDPMFDLATDLCGDGAGESVLVLEVIEETALGDARGRHNVVDGDRVDRAVRQEVNPRAEK